MVRLITHNLLACHITNCTSNHFPLTFKDIQIELRDAEFNPNFLRGFLPKIEGHCWGCQGGGYIITSLFTSILINGLIVSCRWVTHLCLQKNQRWSTMNFYTLCITSCWKWVLSLLSCSHHVSNQIVPLIFGCFKIRIEEGVMICQNCNHVYLISNGIPNMACSLLPLSLHVVTHVIFCHQISHLQSMKSVNMG